MLDVNEISKFPLHYRTFLITIPLLLLRVPVMYDYPKQNHVVPSSKETPCMKTCKGQISGKWVEYQIVRTPKPIYDTNLLKIVVTFLKKLKFVNFFDQNRG